MKEGRRRIKSCIYTLRGGVRYGVEGAEGVVKSSKGSRRHEGGSGEGTEGWCMHGALTCGLYSRTQKGGVKNRYGHEGRIAQTGKNEK